MTDDPQVNSHPQRSTASHSICTCNTKPGESTATTSTDQTTTRITPETHSQENLQHPHHPRTAVRQSQESLPATTSTDQTNLHTKPEKHLQRPPSKNSCSTKPGKPTATTNTDQTTTPFSPVTQSQENVRRPPSKNSCYTKPGKPAAIKPSKNRQPLDLYF